MIIIDRLEGELAVLEIEGNTYTLPIAALPPQAKEGDVLCISVDDLETEHRANALKARVHRIFTKQ